MKRKGFTLIELLVCILIIAVLAGIVIPQYRYSVAKSKFSQLRVAARAIREAQKRYMLVNNKQWTFDLTALDINIEGGTYYKNTSDNDRIRFNWGECGLTDDAKRDSIFCSIEKPKIIYFINFARGSKECCASKASGNIGKKLCQSEISNITTIWNRDDYCGVGGTIYRGF